MLLITGRIGDKTYDEEKISADKLIDLLDLPLKKTGELKFIRHYTDGVKKDVDGVPREKGTSSFPPVEKGLFKGEYLEIRFATTIGVHQETKLKKYTPVRLEFSGKKKVFNMAGDDKEEAVLFYLKRYNSESPFKKRGITPVYKVEDLAKEAAIKYKSILAKQKIINEIINSTDALGILKKAKGINIKNYPIILSPNPTIEECKAALLKAIESKPKEFIKAYNSASVDIEGLIAHAKDQGFIINKSIGGGNSRWVYSEGLGGAEIVKVPKDVDVNDKLASHLTEVDNFVDFAKKVNGAMAKSGMMMNVETLAKKGLIDSSVAPKLVTDMNQEELVNAAYDAGLIDLDRSKGEVRWTNEEGEFLNKKMLSKVKDKRNWRSELAAMKNKVVFDTLRGALAPPKK